MSPPDELDDAAWFTAHPRDSERVRAATADEVERLWEPDELAISASPPRVRVDLVAPFTRRVTALKGGVEELL